MSVRLRDIVVQIFYGVLQAVQKNVWNVSGTIMPIIWISVEKSSAETPQ